MKHGGIFAYSQYSESPRRPCWSTVTVNTDITRRVSQTFPLAKEKPIKTKCWKTVNFWRWVLELVHQTRWCSSILRRLSAISKLTKLCLERKKKYHSQYGRSLTSFHTYVLASGCLQTKLQRRLSNNNNKRNRVSRWCKLQVFRILFIYCLFFFCFIFGVVSFCFNTSLSQ